MAGRAALCLFPTVLAHISLALDTHLREFITFCVIDPSFTLADGWYTDVMWTAEEAWGGDA